MPLEDFIIIVYCCVVDNYAALVKSPLRSRGFETKLSDEEVITMEIVGEFMGKDQDKSLWRYFRNHWHEGVSQFGITVKLCKAECEFRVVKRTDNEAISATNGFL